MAYELRIFISLIGILLFALILELVRKKRLREDLSPVWLFVGIILVFGAFADRILDPIAFALGIKYPPLLLFVIIFFLFLIVALYFSIVISQLKTQNKELIQKIALIEYSLNNDRTHNDSEGAKKR